jgi:hypothetical protein
VRASDWIVECGDFQSSDIMRHQLGREVVPPRWPERMAINKSPVSWKAILIRVSALASLYVIGSTLRVLHVDFSVKCSRERTQECVGGGRSIHDTIKRGQKTDWTELLRKIKVVVVQYIHTHKLRQAYRPPRALSHFVMISFYLSIEKKRNGRMNNSELVRCGTRGGHAGWQKE